VSQSLRVFTAPAAPTISLVENTGITGELTPITRRAELVIGDLLDPATQTRTVQVINTVDGTVASGSTYVAPTVSGTYQIVVTDTTTATGESAISVFTFTLDTEAPATPSLQLVNDTSGNSLITSDGTLLAIGAEAGALVEYLVIAGPDSSGAVWTSALPVFTVDGRYRVLVRQSDAAGNVSDPSAAFVFTLDRTRPVKPTVVLEFDSADGTLDNITDTDGFIVTGNATDDIVEFSTDNGVTWSTSAPDNLPNGTYTVLVRLTDLAGNVSDVSDPLVFTIQKTLPAGPGDPIISNDSGSAGDNITNILPIFDTSGLAAGDRYQFKVNLAGSSTNTEWVDTLSEADFAVDGDYVIEVRVASENGTVSAETEEVDITIDRTVAEVAATLVNDTDGDGAIAEPPVFDFAEVEAGARVEFSTDEGTTWRAVSELASLGAGDYTVLFHQVDIAGNISLASDGITFTLTGGDGDSDGDGDGETDGDGDTGGDRGGFGSGHDGAGAGLTGSDFGWL
jgi:Bacterial Ig-like domain